MSIKSIMSINRDKTCIGSKTGVNSTRAGLSPSASAAIADSSHPSSKSPIHAGDREQQRILSLLQDQTELFDLISDQAPLQETLGRLAIFAEHVVDSVLCSVQVLDLDGKHFIQFAAPNLSGGCIHDISLGSIDDMASVGAISVVSESPLCIADILTDRQKAPKTFDSLASTYGVHGAWAYPVADRTGRPLGALTLYLSVPRVPTVEEEQIVRTLTGLARFAIEHDRWNDALRSADQRFGTLAANIPGVVYQRSVSPDGDIRYTYISDGVQDLFGVSPNEILADPNALFDCHGARYRESFRQNLLDASRELRMWDVEASIITKSGEKKFTHAIARPHRKPDGTVLWEGVILDVTRVKEAEIEAAAVETRTRDTILESISEGLVLYDKDDRLVVCNSNFLRLHPELSDVIQPGVSYQTVTKALIDSSLGAEVTAEERGEILFHQIRSHHSGSHKAEWRLPSGRWVLINEQRTSYGSTAIVHTDVTELKKRQAKLERSNQELQQFASIASHDLQEPLRKIEAFGNRLKSICAHQLGEEGALYLERIQSSTSRMRGLINDLLTYSRVTTKSRPFEPCNLEFIAAEVVSDLQLQVEESGGRVEIGKLPIIDADAMQMRQLLQNLISNAIKFRREEVAPVVKISVQSAAGGPLLAGPAGTAGDMCELTVSDNGIGFDMKYVGRIFDIFQRLHSRSEYAGTGIGLATCRKIVERHGGMLQATSEPGKGATFTASLPVKHERMESTV